jgi:hypothetical protein
VIAGINKNEQATREIASISDHMSVRMLCPGSANCYINGPAVGITIHMNPALSSCRDTTLAIWLLPSGISDMQTTFPRLSKLIAASPPGKFSRRRQDASVCNGHISQVRTTKLNRGVSILRTRIEMILEVNFPVKSQRLVIRQPIR